MKFLPQKNKIVLSFDFGASSVKVVEGKFANNNLVINNAISIKLPKNLYSNGLINNIDELANIIKINLASNKIEFGDAYGVINNSSVITREITLPSVGTKEIDSILEYQLNEYFPVDPENYHVQYIIQEKIKVEGVEKLNILLVGILKDTVIRHFELMKKIGLEPKILDYQGNSILKLLNHNRTVNEGINIKGNTIGIIDMGMDSTKIMIFKENIIKVTRVLNIGANNLLNDLSSLLADSEMHFEDQIREITDINWELNTDGDMSLDTEYYRILTRTRVTLEEIIESCEMTFRYYRTREVGNKIDYIFLHGGLSEIKGIDEMFTEYLNIPCNRIRAFDNIKNNYSYSIYANAIAGLIRVKEV